MVDLRADAAELTVPGKPYDAGRHRYLSMIGGIRPMLLDDQVKLNDPGGSQYLIENSRAGRLERAASLLRRRGVEASEPPRRRDPSRPKLCRRGRLSRRSGRRVALARDFVDEAGPARGGEGRVHSLSDDETRRARCRLGTADGRLRR